jgi:hypothetical protein
MKQNKEIVTSTSLGVVLAISIPLVVLMYQSARGQNRQLSLVTIRRVKLSSIVLDLPDDLLDDVLLSWLTLSDLAQLDKALLKTRARARVLKRLVSAGPLHCSIEEQRAFHKSKTHTAMLLWVQKRRLRLDGFLVRDVNCAYGLWLYPQKPSFLQTWFGDHIAWLSFEGSSYITFMEVIKLCPNLQWLFMDCVLGNRAESTAYNSQMVGTIEPAYRGGIEDTAFLMLCRGCKMLEHLEMTSRCGVTERSLVCGLEQLPGLTFLRYSPSIPLHDATLSAIGRSCPCLRTFITGTRTLTQKQVLHYARCFPSLTSFGPPPQDAIPDYPAILRLCPYIRELTVSTGMTSKYVSALLAEHGQLTHLRVRADHVRELLSVRSSQVQTLTIGADSAEQLPAIPVMQVREAFSNLRALQCVMYDDCADFLPRRTYTYQSLRRRVQGELNSTSMWVSVHW